MACHAPRLPRDVLRCFPDVNIRFDYVEHIAPRDDAAALACYCDATPAAMMLALPLPAASAAAAFAPRTSPQRCYSGSAQLNRYARSAGV